VHGDFWSFVGARRCLGLSRLVFARSRVNVAFFFFSRLEFFSFFQPSPGASRAWNLRSAAGPLRPSRPPRMLCTEGLANLAFFFCPSSSLSREPRCVLRARSPVPPRVALSVFFPLFLHTPRCWTSTSLFSFFRLAIPAKIPAWPWPSACRFPLLAPPRIWVTHRDLFFLFSLRRLLCFAYNCLRKRNRSALRSVIPPGPTPSPALDRLYSLFFLSRFFFQVWKSAPVFSIMRARWPPLTALSFPLLRGVTF